MDLGDWFTILSLTNKMVFVIVECLTPKFSPNTREMGIQGHLQNTGIFSFSISNTVISWGRDGRDPHDGNLISEGSG